MEHYYIIVFNPSLFSQNRNPRIATIHHHQPFMLAITCLNEELHTTSIWIVDLKQQPAMKITPCVATGKHYEASVANVVQPWCIHPPHTRWNHYPCTSHCCHLKTWTTVPLEVAPPCTAWSKVGHDQICTHTTSFEHHHDINSNLQI